MKKRTITYLTDANLITCVIQKDLAEPVLEAAKNAGAQGATISYAQGTGIRESEWVCWVSQLMSKKK